MIICVIIIIVCFIGYMWLIIFLFDRIEKYLENIIDILKRRQ
jgi:hypothetical protein